ncbi:MAG: L-2-amino-thiazoline-4-carboxylic acid hydrolase [Desulfopila sp.]|jgi:hypothetical protein|nr:L-2-amino-thiazoline-4-carboxylic acid hydrolase [Desulfopila sp.]
MIETAELQLTEDDHDKAFIEVCFLLDMFVDTIEKFVGKSTPSLAVAAGRKMAANMPIHLTDPEPGKALSELVRVFTIQQMDIAGEMEGNEAVITMNRCPIGAVCKERKMDLDGAACQMFHYYIAGIMAEFTGRPARPKTLAAGDTCTFKLAFSGAPRSS